MTNIIPIHFSAYKLILRSTPKLLIADEITLGLSPNYVGLLAQKLLQINNLGVAILLVEQNVSLALEVSHRTYVYKMGTIDYSDSSEVVKSKIDLKETFLGK